MTGHSRGSLRLTWAVGVLALLLLPSAYGTAYVWNGVSGGDWNTATNWTPNGVPGSASGDTATFNNAGNLTVNVSSSPANAITTVTLNNSPTDSISVNNGATLIINTLAGGANLTMSTTGTGTLT